MGAGTSPRRATSCTSPLPVSCYAFLGNLLEGGILLWVKIFAEHTKLSFQLSDQNSSLQMVIPVSVSRCFQGKHIVLMGDSLTRYQYVNLAYLLSRLQRAEPYGGIEGQPSLSMEIEWKDWHQYYHFSSAILGAAIDGCAAEICDCRRDKEDAALDMTREYRTLHLSFPHHCQAKCHPRTSSEAVKHLVVSYHQIFGRPDPETAGKEGMKYYEQSFQQQPPDILVFNMGHHAAQLQSGEVYHNTMSAILQSGDELRRLHDTELIWKTTTPRRSTATHAHKDQELQLVKSFNITGFDIGKIVSAGLKQGMNFYWDDLHFLPFVYQQFNDILLNSLCS